MMQISNKVFRHKSLEKGDRLLFCRLLFWVRKESILKTNGDSSLLCENRKEIGTIPSLKKVACPLFMSSFSPVLPRAYRLLDLTKIRG